MLLIYHRSIGIPNEMQTKSQNYIMDFDLVFFVCFSKEKDTETHGTQITCHKLCVITGRFTRDAQTLTQLLVAELLIWEMQ